MVTPLRQRMLDDMRVRNLAATTQREYILQVIRFAKYFGKSFVPPTTFFQERTRQNLSR